MPLVNEIITASVFSHILTNVPSVSPVTTVPPSVTPVPPLFTKSNKSQGSHTQPADVYSSTVWESISLGNDRIHQGARYSSVCAVILLILQPLMSSEGPDDIYNLNSQIDTYDNFFTCYFIDIDNIDLQGVF